MLSTLFSKSRDRSSIALAGGAIIASPLIWNLVARNEYRNHTLARILGSPKAGCYALAAWIFMSSLARDLLFGQAMLRNRDSHCVDPTNNSTVVTALGVAGRALMGSGLVLVLSSMYRLGVTGTYLGDYFGILMSERVTGFPFNVCSDPMYTGATMQFLGSAVAANNSVGVGLSALVAIVYYVAAKQFEGPFTGFIYSQRDVATEAKQKQLVAKRL